jgi:hypothetical protein
MSSAPSAESVRIAESRPGYPGWRVAAICHIGVLAGFATVFINSFSFMVQPMQHEFGWDRGQISLAQSTEAPAPKLARSELSTQNS